MLELFQSDEFSSLTSQLKKTFNLKILFQWKKEIGIMKKDSKSGVLKTFGPTLWVFTENSPLIS